MEPGQLPLRCGVWGLAFRDRNSALHSLRKALSQSLTHPLTHPLTHSPALQLRLRWRERARARARARERERERERDPKPPKHAAVRYEYNGSSECESPGAAKRRENSAPAVVGILNASPVAVRLASTAISPAGANRILDGSQRKKKLNRHYVNSRPAKI